LKINIKKLVLIFLIFFGVNFVAIFFYKNLDNFLKINFNLNRLTIFFDILIYFIAVFFFYTKVSNDKILNLFKKLKKSLKKDYLNLFICLLIFFLGIYYFKLSQMELNRDLFYPRTIYGFIKYIAVRIEKIHFFYGFLLTLTYLLSYRLLRFSLNKYLAIIASIFFVTSEIHLYNLIPSIERDYFKVIILLIVSLFLIFIFRANNLDKKKFFYYILAFFIGICLTVRNDILIYIIPMIISVFFQLNKPFKFSLIFIIITFCSFLMVPDRGGGIGGTLTDSMSIVLYTGLMNNFSFLMGQSNNYFISNINEQPLVEYYLSTINNNYILVYIKYVLTFCFDFILKLIFSANQILNLFYVYSDAPIMLEKIYFPIYEIKNIFLGKLIGYGSIFFLASIIFLKKNFNEVKHYYLFIAYILFLIFTPVIYFFLRHYFHLEIISIWSLFYLMQCLFSILINEFKKKYN